MSVRIQLSSNFQVVELSYETWLDVNKPEVEEAVKLVRELGESINVKHNRTNVNIHGDNDNGELIESTSNDESIDDYLDRKLAMKNNNKLVNVEIDNINTIINKASDKQINYAVSLGLDRNHAVNMTSKELWTWINNHK